MVYLINTAERTRRVFVGSPVGRGFPTPPRFNVNIPFSAGMESPPYIASRLDRNPR